MVKLSAEGAVECPLPTSLSANNITPTSANLQWDDAPEAIGYRIKYKAAGTSQWLVTSSTDNQTAITGLIPNTEYRWQVKTICSQSPLITSDSSAHADFITPPMRFGEDANTSFKMVIFPNPASENATISFSLSEESQVTIAPMDVNGKLVKEIANSKYAEGIYQISFYSKDIPAGVYLIQLTTKEELVTKKFIIER